MIYFESFAGVGGFSLVMKYALDSVTRGAKRRSENNQEDNEKTRQGLQSLQEKDNRIQNRWTGEYNNRSSNQRQFTCVGFSEIDKYASAVLRYRFPHVKNYGDITNIDWSTVPDFDLLVGGSPCQDFSVAGRRQGIGGKRSGLFWEYVRALREKKPNYFIWENVKGVLSSHGGRDFETILNSMAEAGYSLWWQVLNAKDFGVPQNRERVFVVGTRNGSPREVFFEAGTDTKNLIEITQHASDARRVYDPEGIGRTLKGLGGGQGAKSMLIAKTVRTGGRSSLHDSKQNRDSYKIDRRIRRLTPIECERLMGWPDEWTRIGERENSVMKLFEVSDSQRYKMCGNGVVSKVISEIIKAHLR